MKKYAGKKIINTEEVNRTLFIITLEDGTKKTLTAEEYSNLSYYDRYTFLQSSVKLEKVGESKWCIVDPRHEKAEELFKLVKEYNDAKIKLDEIRARYDKEREAYAREYGVTLPDVLSN